MTNSAAQNEQKAQDQQQAQRVGESNSTDLLCAGQIKKRDIVWITYKGNRRPYDVEDVLMPNTDTAEILLDIDDNLYFITSMALDGSSWAKDVKVNIVGT